MFSLFLFYAAYSLCSQQLDLFFYFSFKFYFSLFTKLSATSFLIVCSILLFPFLLHWQFFFFFFFYFSLFLFFSDIFALANLALQVAPIVLSTLCILLIPIGFVCCYFLQRKETFLSFFLFVSFTSICILLF